MKIHSHKISITDAEMEIIGDALCETIKNEVEMWVRVTDLDGVKNQLEGEMDLLRHFTDIGYKVWVQGGEGVLGGSYDCGIDVWFDTIYTDAVAKHEAGKVK